MLNRRLPSLTRRTGLVGGASLTGTTSSISFSSVRFNSNNNSSKNEDADEIAREQRLREMFNNKGGSSNPAAGGKASMWDQFKQIHAQAKQFAEQQTAAQMAARQQNQQGGNASNSTNATTSTNSSTTNVENLTSSGQQQQQGTNNTSSGGRPPVPSWFGPSQSFWTVMIYATALYSSFLVWQLSDEQSFVSLTQGVPHWANSGYDAAAYMLFRIIYSYRDQRRIQGEFEAMAPMAGSASFLDFLAQRYSMNLSGSTVSFQEVVALIAGAMRQDFPRYTTVIAQAANGARGEAREKIDAIANALRSQGVQPMYYNTNTNNNNNNNSNQQQQQQRYPNQQQQFLGVPSHTYSPYSAPIPQQLQQQAQGMHPVSMTGYGNPQMMQQFQQRVYNPYYAQQQQQQGQPQNSTTGSAVADSSTTSGTNNEQPQGGDSSSSAPAADKQ